MSLCRHFLGAPKEVQLEVSELEVKSGEKTRWYGSLSHYL